MREVEKGAGESNDLSGTLSLGQLQSLQEPHLPSPQTPIGGEGATKEGRC